jgi:hypothetical protein
MALLIGIRCTHSDFSPSAEQLESVHLVILISPSKSLDAIPEFDVLSDLHIETCALVHNLAWLQEDVSLFFSLFLSLACSDRKVVCVIKSFQVLVHLGHVFG